MAGEYLQKYTYEYILNRALEKAPEGIDKRVGSIIYDALAPACYELADMYLQLWNVVQDIYAQTASGEYLELKAGEVGLTRREATHAVQLGRVTDNRGRPMEVEIGYRFSTIGEFPMIYEIIKRESPGIYSFRCEEPGLKGNKYRGQLVPITNINNLGLVELYELTVPGSDTETDEELRTRFFQYVNEKAFGGNFINYVSEVQNFEGVGAVQVYPVWNGGGTVKVVVIDTEFNPASTSFLQTIKKWIDPEPHDGTGAGFAPIGHQVTVATPKKKMIDIELGVEIIGFNIAQVTPLIEEKIEEIFLQLRKDWGKFSADNKYYLKVFRSKIITELMYLTGISNVKNVKLNGLDDDIALKFDNNTSELPYVGKVTVNEDYS